MTKQEKLDVKFLLLGIKGSLFDEQWQNIVNEFPFVLQDDDDIEDDVLTDTQDVPQVPAWEIGKRKMIDRRSGFNHNDIEHAVDRVVGFWGTEAYVQPLDAFVVEEEHGMGLYFKPSNTFVRSTNGGGGIVNTSDKDEQAYLLHLGYKRFSDLNIGDNN